MRIALPTLPKNLCNAWLGPPVLPVWLELEQPRERQGWEGCRVLPFNFPRAKEALDVYPRRRPRVRLAATAHGGLTIHT